MKTMEKIQKTLIGISILAVSVALIYVFFVIGGIGSSNSGSDNFGFPIGSLPAIWIPIIVILFGSLPAIWIPIMVRKREEARERDENQYTQRRV